MKKMKYKYLYGAGIVAMVILAACSKSFLEKPPIGTLSPEIVATEKGIQGLLIGAYSLLDGNGSSGDGITSAASNWTYGGIASDDAYKGSDPSDFADLAPFEQFATLTPNNGASSGKWNLGYNGAQRCNGVLNTLALAKDISDSKKTGIIAQARFLRAFYHMELKKVYNNIFYADETVNPENTKVINTTDVWPNIEADLKFAVDNLPEDWKTEPGRVNKSAAKAFLAKAYMFQKKFTAAYPILQDLIANGKTAKGDKYGLTPQFYSNFNPAQKNSKESVFAVQTSVGDNSSVDWGGAPNGNFGDLLNFPYNGGPGACCGFYNPSQDLGNAFKTDANGLPLLDESYATGLNVSDPTTPYTGTLDPRVDLTAGRKGIPYLDWGNHPGDDWIRNVPNDGHFSPKKNVYALSQKGFTDVGSAYWGATEIVANNVNLIRFADILLWAAECAVIAGDLPTAMANVNMVRARAADPSGWVYKNSEYNAATAMYATQTTPAANYKIGLYTAATFTAANAMKAVYFERRLELAMEGHRFFDLVRWGIAAPTLNTYIGREKSIRPLKLNASFTAGKNEYFPIPQGSIDKLNSDGTIRLKQNPGY